MPPLSQDQATATPRTPSPMRPDTLQLFPPATPSTPPSRFTASPADSFFDPPSPLHIHHLLRRQTTASLFFADNGESDLPRNEMSASTPTLRPSSSRRNATYHGSARPTVSSSSSFSSGRPSSSGGPVPGGGQSPLQRLYAHRSARSSTTTLGLRSGGWGGESET